MRKLLVLLVAAASLAALPAHADRGAAGYGSRAAPAGSGPGAAGHYGRGVHHGPVYRGSSGYHHYGAYRGGAYYPWAGLAVFGTIAALGIFAESTWPAYSAPYDAAAVVGGPTLFVEQQTGEGSPYPAGNWYYCVSSTLYYPYATACPEGWQAVAPTP